ncbi:hypothetical protein AQI70_29950 [Streptomyces curacoi]|uniref:Uncharacterized protein n=1 Tax=Streptomyces curacoi TaxID=146536 RepID=A0A117NYQ7_9ACTN|nr:hypothetical protein AQI70_29950 [Streptomyces curacoi]
MPSQVRGFPSQHQHSSGAFWLIQGAGTRRSPLREPPSEKHLFFTSTRAKWVTRAMPPRRGECAGDDQHEGHAVRLGVVLRVRRRQGGGAQGGGEQGGELLRGETGQQEEHRAR